MTKAKKSLLIPAAVAGLGVAAGYVALDYELRPVGASPEGFDRL